MRKRYVNPEGVFVSPYFTHAVGAADAMIVHVAGQVAYDEAGNVVGRGDMRAQAERILHSLGRILEAYGAGYDDVLRITAYMVNLNPANASAWREVRAKYFDPSALPASTLIGITNLVHPELLLEVEAEFAAPLAAGAKAASPARRRARRTAPGAAKRRR